MKNKLLDQFIDEKFIIQRHTLTHTHIHIELLEIDYGSCCKNGSSVIYLRLGPNCKFIDLLFKRLVITFIKINFLNCFIVLQIIFSQTDTLTEELMYLR